jgi:hypothetical protein
MCYAIIANSPSIEKFSIIANMALWALGDLEMFTFCSHNGPRRSNDSRGAWMLFYRVREFGKPKGPWRVSKRLAQQDALDLGLGEYDEWGIFFVHVPGEIEELHERFVRQTA